MFSTHSPQLLFYFEDVANVERNNDHEKQNQLNRTLEFIQRKLKAKHINFIFMPAPDKFDLYYDQLKNKEKFPAPRILNQLELLPKTYQYVNTKKILQEHLGKSIDLYFYDDTHWTPVSCKMIADELRKRIH